MRGQEEIEFVRVRLLRHGKGKHRCDEDHEVRDGRRRFEARYRLDLYTNPEQVPFGAAQPLPGKSTMTQCPSRDCS